MTHIHAVFEPPARAVACTGKRCRLCKKGVARLPIEETQKHRGTSIGHEARHGGLHRAIRCGCPMHGEYGCPGRVDAEGRCETCGVGACLKRKPTHRCKVCGALWILFPPDPSAPEGLRNGSWSHVYGSPLEKCCDNVEMGEQIEALA